MAKNQTKQIKTIISSQSVFMMNWAPYPMILVVAFSGDKVFHGLVQRWPSLRGSVGYTQQRPLYNTCQCPTGPAEGAHWLANIYGKTKHLSFSHYPWKHGMAIIYCKTKYLSLHFIHGNMVFTMLITKSTEIGWLWLSHSCLLKLLTSLSNLFSKGLLILALHLLLCIWTQSFII